MKTILALLLTASVLSGATVDFCGGQILCAELTTTAPACVKTLKSSDCIFPDLPAPAVYGILTVTMDQGRTLNLQDYAIQFIGRSYHCIAILKNDKLISLASGSGSSWKQVEMVDPKARYTLIFAISPNEVSNTQGKSEGLPLSPLFRNNTDYIETIQFEGLGSKAMTPAQKVPSAGKMTVTK